MITSRITRSTSSVIAFWTASMPSRASATPKPAAASILESMVTTTGLSSATRMHGVVTAVGDLTLEDRAGVSYHGGLSDHMKLKPRGPFLRIDTNGNSLLIPMGTGARREVR